MTVIQTILCWSLIAVPSLLAVLLLVRTMRRCLWPGHPVCLGCCYDLTGASGARCPECGADPQSRRALWRNRRFTEPLMIAAVLLAIGFYGFAVRERVDRTDESWDTALIPTTALLLTLPWTGADQQTLLGDRFFKNTSENHEHGWWWQGEWLIHRDRKLIDWQNPIKMDIAMKSLERFAPRHHSAVKALCDATRNSRPEMRRYVVPFLRDVYPSLQAKSDRALIVETLQDVIRNESETWNLLVELNELMRFDTDVVRQSMDLLLDLTEHADQSVRVLAYDTIARLGPEQFKHLTDDCLSRLLDDIGAEASYVDGGITYFYGMRDLVPDPYLHEIIRRGGAFFEQRLKERLEQRHDSPDQPTFRPTRRFGVYWTWPELGQLEVLTTLRRIQHQPDPLSVQASLIGLDLNIVTVRLVNSDPDQRVLIMQDGGDNRGPRMERFNIEVRDAQDRLVSTQFPTTNFGGMSSIRELPAGEVMLFTFPLVDYAHMPTQPGAYTLRVHYHNVLQIAAEPDVSGYITSCSEPIEVTIK